MQSVVERKGFGGGLYGCGRAMDIVDDTSDGGGCVFDIVDAGWSWTAAAIEERVASGSGVSLAIDLVIFRCRCCEVSRNGARPLRN